MVISKCYSALKAALSYNRFCRLLTSSHSEQKNAGILGKQLAYGR